MKWHSISEVAKVVNLSRQAVYKKLKRLSLEEKLGLGENLLEDGQIRLSEDGIKKLFGVSTNDNQVDKPVVEKVVIPVNHDVVMGLQTQLSAKETEVVRIGDILDKVLGQLEEERRLRGEERQRTDTILMKLTNDISTLQKALEYKPSESPIPLAKKEPAFNQFKKTPATIRVDPLPPVQRQISPFESVASLFDDVLGFAFGRG